jgi:hypothetical protein
VTIRSYSYPTFRIKPRPRKVRAKEISLYARSIQEFEDRLKNHVDTKKLAIGDFIVFPYIANGQNSVLEEEKFIEVIEKLNISHDDRLTAKLKRWYGTRAVRVVGLPYVEEMSEDFNFEEKDLQSAYDFKARDYAKGKTS